MELVEIEPTTAPSLIQGLQRDVEPDRIAEPETVRDSSSEAINAHDMPFKSMLLDTLPKHRRRDADGLKRRTAEPWNSRTTRDGDPDLMGQLRPDVVESQSRKQADNG